MKREAINIEKEVLAKARRAKKGTLLFPDYFRDIGKAVTIRKALQRLSDKNLLMWVAQGIYVIPQESKLIGKVRPGLKEIAEAIAKRDKARIVPTGIEALNRLGLNTQVPMNIVYLTDGAQRKIAVGKAKINFKKTTPKNLSAKGEISGLVIQALRTIGKGKVTNEEIEKIILLLKKENKKKLQHDINLAPAWVAEIMSKAVTKK